MAAPLAPLSSTDPAPAPAAGTASPGSGDLRYFVFGLFFIFGGITSLNDIIIPKLKDLFTLDYTQALLVQSAFFAAYFFVSLPAAAIVKKLGYMRTASIGLLTMMTGCLLFVPASLSGQFVAFLGALFVLAAGITIVQVVANPLIALLGPPRTAHSRLTFAQAFNSLGTTIFPYFGSIIILGSLATVSAADLSGEALDRFREEETRVVVNTYLALAAALAVIAAVVWSRRKSLAETPSEGFHFARAFALLGERRFGLGALCIFLYVGAEVAIGSVIVSYLMRADTLGLAEQLAGKHVPFYWGGAMVGRFIGAGLLRVVRPGWVLAGAGSMTILLLLVSMNTTGLVSGWSLLAIGLFNSIMFPTIFTLASEDLGTRTPEGSGIICVAISGGAVIPLLLGAAADASGLRQALLVPAACYAVILAYGVWAAAARSRAPAPLHAI